MVRLLCLENSSFNFWWSCCIRKTPQENTALSFCSCQCHVPELLVWGKKKHTSPLPRYISAFSQTISWPTSWSCDWLIANSRWGFVTRLLTHSNAICIHQPKNYQCQISLLFLLPTGWVGRWNVFNSAWIPSVHRFPVSPAAAYFIQLFLYVVFAQQSGSETFGSLPYKYKTECQFSLEHLWGNLEMFDGVQEGIL